MNSPVKIILTALAAFAAGAALVFYFVKAAPKSGGDTGDAGPTSSPVQLKNDANGEVIITLNAETQERLGLKMAAPAAAQWQPEVKGYGRVIDPAALSAAVADLESTRAAAATSTKEFDRLKILVAQDNVSTRALEAAEAAATHDKLAFESALEKFKLDWGRSLANGSDREKILSEAVSGQTALVRIDLPAGETLPSPPASARIVALTDETKSVDGTLCSATAGVNPQTQSQSFFFLVQNQPLAPGAAVTGFLKISGPALAGEIVPADAVLRHDGKGWVYAQTGTNEFTRCEIPLDRPATDGWFVSGVSTATNRVIVSGAQTVLSAELSGGNFNSGSRD